MLDPRSPFTVDTHDLGRRAGAMKEFDRTVDLTEPMGTDVIAVPDQIDLHVRLESVVEGVLVTGDLSATARGECVRCLDPVVIELDSRFQELYVYGPEQHSRGSVAVEMEGEDDEVLAMEGDLLSIELPIRDAVVLSLPMTPLCDPDCPGLCPECGIRLADEPGHGHEVSDPRWEALRAALEEKE